MEPLVLIAPLSVALSVLQGYWGGKGWYDCTGLWTPFQAAYDERKPRTGLRATAAPFVPACAQNRLGSPNIDPSGFLSHADCRQLRAVSRNHLENWSGDLPDIGTGKSQDINEDLTVSEDEALEGDWPDLYSNPVRQRNPSPATMKVMKKKS